MNERPTPETDSIIRNAQTADHLPTRLAATLTVKCGKLERERDEVREKAERYRLDANALMLQRDEARELAQRMSESNQLLMADVRFYRNAWEQIKEGAK